MNCHAKARNDLFQNLAAQSGNQPRKERFAAGRLVSACLDPAHIATQINGLGLAFRLRPFFACEKPKFSLGKLGTSGKYQHLTAVSFMTKTQFTFRPRPSPAGAVF